MSFKERSRASHLAGVLNVLADQLSRVEIHPTEFFTDNQIVQEIFHTWGTPMINLFATEQKRKL